MLAVDSSDHANRGVEDGIALAQLSGARVTAAHVYAAKMHDMRFRQMEGGLPERFREEQELERQRDVHNDLITRGLSIIADSYLDQVNRACNTAGVKFVRRNLEGKNYRQLSKEANSGSYDLLVLGALG
ncbi:MAG TPA: universal stress protein, partial [Gammaproteobacteria bacterium]